MDAAKARQLAIGWLARREHSRAEITAKLVRKGCAVEVATQVAGDLVTQDYLSDERLAEAVARSRRRRGYGPMRIRKDLEQKGLADETIARWIGGAPEDWRADAERVRRRKFGDGKPQNIEERARQIRFLQQRGFTYEQIRQALNAPAAD
jgi:regulatory protein